MSDLKISPVVDNQVLADKAIAAIKTQPKSIVSDEEMMQAVRTLLIRLG